MAAPHPAAAATSGYSSMGVDSQRHSWDSSLAPGERDTIPSALPFPTAPVAPLVSRQLPPVPKFSPENSPGISLLTAKNPISALAEVASLHNGSACPTFRGSPSSSPPFPSRDIPLVTKFDISFDAIPPQNAPASPGLAGSASALSRELPPIPKLTVNDVSMGPPPPKPSDGGRGLMGPPPPVLKFQTSSSGAKSAMDPPKLPTRSQSSCQLQPSQDLEHSLLAQRSTEAAQSPTNGVDDAPAHTNGRSAVKIASLSVDGEGKRRELHAAGAVSAASPGQPPYVKPSWSAAPGRPYTLESLKEGNILGIEDVSKRAAYMFGRSDRCDFVLEHPTVSRYHAVLQYNAQGESFVYDLCSTHGTFINKIQVKGREYVPLHVGDIVRFGFSSRLHAFQGPIELMPKEGLSKEEWQAQRFFEAAEYRAVSQASLICVMKDRMSSNVISWGMQDDAEEEAEEKVEEVTWQTFKGKLTERQQKTLGKIHKYNDKLANLRKEIDAIQAKEISQGGLTQGQQMQIARNEQRIEQLVEEVEILEETLNDSIQESISGQTGMKRRSNITPFEDDEEDPSDDEFYDRASNSQSRKETVEKVETAESLLDQKAALAREIETLCEAITAEQKNPRLSQEPATEDPLDKFMKDLSSTIVKDKACHLRKELDSLTKELERVEHFLKIADPTCDGLRKWEHKNRSAVDNCQAKSLTRVMIRASPRKEDAQELATSVVDSKGVVPGGISNTEELKSDGGTDKIPLSTEDMAVLPSLEPPIWLGAPVPEVAEELKPEVSEKVNKEAISFVTYKERNKGICSKHLVKKGERQISTDIEDEMSIVALHVADSIALLLRQKRGLGEIDSDISQNTQLKSSIASIEEKQPSKEPCNKRKKQAVACLPGSTELDINEDWVPPAGQTGDGRTALNDKYGY